MQPCVKLSAARRSVRVFFLNSELHFIHGVSPFLYGFIVAQFTKGVRSTDTGLRLAKGGSLPMVYHWYNTVHRTKTRICGPGNFPCMQPPAASLLLHGGDENVTYSETAETVSSTLHIMAPFLQESSRFLSSIRFTVSSQRFAKGATLQSVCDTAAGLSLLTCLLSYCRFVEVPWGCSGSSGLM